MCRILRIRRVRTSSCHQASNGVVERWNPSLHSGISQYVNFTPTNWDNLIHFPYVLSGYTKYHYKLQPILPTSWQRSAKLSQKNQDQEQRVESLQSNLKLAYTLVAKANRKAHQKNKRNYDCKAKPRKIAINYLTYLYTPVSKSGLTKIFINHGKDQIV